MTAGNPPSRPRKFLCVVLYDHSANRQYSTAAYHARVAARRRATRRALIARALRLYEEEEAADNRVSNLPTQYYRLLPITNHLAGGVRSRKYLIPPGVHVLTVW